jgi:putative aldouronate transport system substrate-binding protein
MKKKMKAPVFVFALVFALIVQACGGNRDTAKQGVTGTDYLNTESEMPIVKEKITLSLVQSKGPDQGNADELWFWKWAEKEMNIHFEVTQVTSPTEQVNLMFASNELPDVFFEPGLAFTVSNILQYGQKEKQLLAMNDLIDKHAPTLKAKFQQNPSYKAQSTCPDGNIYTLPGFEFTKGEYYSTYRAFIDKVWIDRLGMKMPENLDQFYEVLKAFRDRDPNQNGRQDEIPMSGHDNNIDVIISSAMGYTEPGINLSIKDDDAVLFAASPLYGEYLKYMNRLFSEKLLDNDYYTNTTVQMRAKGAEHRLGVYLDDAPFLVDIERYMDYDAIIPMTSQWNSKRVWTASRDFVPMRGAITSQCKYPEAAMRFLDFFYTDKGAIYSYYGPEKGSPDEMGLAGGWFQTEKGDITYDKVNDGTYTLLEYYLKVVGAKPLLTLGSNRGLDIISARTGIPYGYSAYGAQFRETMDKNVLPYYSPRYPVVYFEDAVNERVLELSSTINDYMIMMDARFITGAEPLSNIPNYLAELQKLGVGELEQIYKDAYSTYKKNL